MEKDYGIQQISEKVSKQIKVNQLEVDKAIASTFKGLHNLLSQGVKQVKVPHLGKFRKRKNLKEDVRGLYHNGERITGT